MERVGSGVESRGGDACRASLESLVCLHSVPPVLPLFLKIYLLSVVYVFVHEHTHLHTCVLVPQRPEEGLGCPGVGVTGSYDMCSGN